LDITIESEEAVVSDTISDRTVKEEMKNEIKMEEPGDTHVSANEVR
jgi:hypothetical protein